MPLMSSCLQNADEGPRHFLKNLKSSEGSLILLFFPRAATKEDSAFGALDCRGTRWNWWLPVLPVTQGKKVAMGLWAFACVIKVNNPKATLLPSFVLKTLNNTFW